jgi:ATP-dependent helicase/nuclease subunit B
VSCRVSYVRYGDAADALDRAVRDLQGADPLAPVTVVVSSLRIGHALRHLLARRATDGDRTGIANIRFVTLADLADELGGTACRAGGRRRLTRSALGAAARIVLARNPGVLAAVADQPSSEAELVALYEELRHDGAEMMDALARQGAFGGEIARLCDEMRTRLTADWYDDADLIDAAIAQIRLAGTDDVIGGTVVVHLPERARSDECRLIAAIASGCDLVVHVGTTGDLVADAPSLRVVTALSKAGLEVPLPSQASVEQCSGLDDTVQVAERIEAPDVDAEVRAALRIVIEHIEGGGAPTRVALLYSSERTYLSALAAALDEANIAWNGRSPRRVAESAAARVVLGMVDLAELGLARERVMTWINSAPIVGADGTPVPAGAFERVSRRAGVTTGDAAEWHRHLGQLIEDLERRSELSRRQGQADDGLAVPITRTGGDLGVAWALDASIDEIARFCDEGMVCRAWSELEEWARGILRRFLGWKDGDERDREGADQRLEATLAELGHLDSIEPEASLSSFGRALNGALERAATYEGRLSYGVAVRSLFDAVGLDLDLAIVLGGVEGELPARARSSPLLSSDDRAALGLEASTSEAVSAATRHALVAVADTARRTVCTWRLRDSGDARARVRSRFFGHDEVTLAPSPVAALTSVASGDRTAIGVSELSIATLRARRAARRELGTFHLVRSDPHLQKAMGVVSSRSAHRFDRFEGRIGVAAGVQVGRVLSPTTLEKYASCPFKYFLSSELGVEFIEEPEKRVEIDRRDRGSIVHEVLELFVADLMNADGDVASVDTPEHLQHVAERVFDHYERLGRTGAPAIWARQRHALLALLEEERRADAHRRATEHRHPVELEWTFGAGDVPPLEIPLQSGSVAFRGKVDRIDRRPDGALLVVDYKTGSGTSYAGLAADPVDAGHHLQLAVYALAASSLLDRSAPVSASYRFLDEEGEEQTVLLGGELVARTSDVVGVIAEGIRSGLFPLNPGEARWPSFANCRYCDFDSVCPPDRDDCWEEASRDPELAPYVELVGGVEDE